MTQTKKHLTAAAPLLTACCKELVGFVAPNREELESFIRAALHAPFCEAENGAFICNRRRGHVGEHIEMHESGEGIAWTNGNELPVIVKKKAGQRLPGRLPASRPSSAGSQPDAPRTAGNRRAKPV